jgi:23S rRNA (cytidine1920-2'-O)/16S rRNA (cytidine1409-2'-O)-methyltransferase
MARANKKIRLDKLMVEKKLVQSRERARQMILAQKVAVNGMILVKAASLVDPDTHITLKSLDMPFVSRGGLKLEAALKSLQWDMTDTVCMDIGASTGGFTDCLLQRGARKIYAVDVGYGQLAWRLRQDNRVIVIERTNIRHLEFERINERMDVIVADTSFISLKIVIPAAEKFMKPGTRILALIKPQFEAGRELVGKKGVVRDNNVRCRVVADIQNFFSCRGYEAEQVIPSPVPGAEGNLEYILPITFLGKI